MATAQKMPDDLLFDDRNNINTIYNINYVDHTLLGNDNDGSDYVPDSNSSSNKDIANSSDSANFERFGHVGVRDEEQNDSSVEEKGCLKNANYGNDDDYYDGNDGDDVNNTPQPGAENVPY